MYSGNFRGGSVQEVKNNILRSTDFPDKDLMLIEGDFRQTLTNIKIEDKSEFPLIFNVDCDIYSSSISVFNWIAKVAQNGSWLLCDDYWLYRGHPDMGQQKAIRDVFTNHPRILLNPYCNYQGFGRAFIINTR